MSNFLANASDLTVLLLFAGCLAGFALATAELTHRFFFGPRAAEIEADIKLCDLVHTSLLAFIAFMLAISVTDVRSNFGKADDAVAREAMHLAAFDREIGEYDVAWSVPARALLQRYVAAVTTEEWPRLAAATPDLAPGVQTILDELRNTLRRVPASDATRNALFAHHDRLELDRSGRYENATRSVPRVFWMLIGGFLVGAAVMNGRFRPSALTRSLIATHFAAIGLCVALILILDAPFRGETSISPAPLTTALRRS